MKTDINAFVQTNRRRDFIFLRCPQKKLKLKKSSFGLLHKSTNEG